jgi:hypothetical protein
MLVSKMSTNTTPGGFSGTAYQRPKLDALPRRLRGLPTSQAVTEDRLTFRPKLWPAQKASSHVVLTGRAPDVP